MRVLVGLLILAKMASPILAREDAVQVIVPFAPGGGSDTIARIFTRAINDQELSDGPWVVVNVPGAGGTIGSRRAKKAPPDGSVVLFLHDAISTAKHSGQTLYGPEDFTPVAATGSVGMLICVSEQAPFEDLTTLLTEASENPDSITFAANIGAPSYYMARILEHSHGKAEFRFVQSGGGATRFADLKGGHITASAFSVSEYLAFRSGGLRALAFLGKERHPALPEVPTASESGINVVYENLQGWWMPSGAAPDTVKSLTKTLSSAMELPAVASAFQEQQIHPLFLDGDGLSKAMEQKDASLRSLSLTAGKTVLPNLLYPIFAILIAGIVLSRTASRHEEQGPKDRSTPKVLMPLLAVAGYLILLQILQGWFLPLTIFFLAASFLVVRKNLPIRSSVATAILVPLALYLFLSILLGYQLP